MLSGEPMPWQKYAADVIGEIGADGLPRWPMVIISVPRQSGKSTLVKSVAVHRALTKPNARVWLTAQTGQDAADLWNECRESIGRSPLAPLFQARKARGSEDLVVPMLGSHFRPHPPGPEKLHGKQSDLNILDEGWVFDEATADELMQAIVPTQATRPGAQVIIISTMGTAASTWFHGLCAKARAGDPEIALLEWGISDGDDPADLQTVAAAHPAYGYTLTEKSLSTGFSKMGGKINQFARAYGNRATGAMERLIPEGVYQAAKSTTDLIPEDARVCFAAAADVDRTEAVIAAGWYNPQTGVVYGEIIDRRPGITWCAKRLAELVEKHDNAGIMIDPASPAGTIADDLKRADIPLLDMTARDLITACQLFWDSITATPPTMRLPEDPALDTAVDLVAKRNIGDGWVWARRGLGGSVAPLEAITLAQYAARHVKPAPPKPQVVM